MSTVNTKMTALADEVRELSGTTDLLGIDDMTSAINTENTNFNSNLNSQNTLIQQIQTALEGKAAGGTTSEDLDAEISEYTSLNSELEEVINSLPEAGGGSGPEVISIAVSASGGPINVFYWDADGYMRNSNGGTISALAGIVFWTDYSNRGSATGEFVYNYGGDGMWPSFRFLADGGTLTISVADISG